ncbi:MAG: 2-oxoacid:acceptor oxidoreductase family protein [Planctomycetes bacterium]|nr:2-oxoacid:acceptor oxidoreductase family protein [Planctomycetota bacterium]
MAAWVETHVGEIACAYPITSSQVIGQTFQAEVARGRANLWGQPLSFLEPESEHSAQSACEGAALAGARVTNFTSGQGLILMKEVLYVISGKRLPMVLHVGSRALTSHALNVHAGHDDVMGVADVGWGILFARNVQDVGDLALVARRVAEDTGFPFMVAQDGFFTTHTIETCRLPEPELMKRYVGDPRERIENLFDPAHPLMSGPVQNQDAYMKGKIAQRDYYGAVPGSLRQAMTELEALTGRACAPLHAHRMEDAEWALVAMGTIYETATVAADHLRRTRNLKVGVVHLTSFRPFPGPDLVRLLSNVRAFSVIERMDAPLGQSNPLTAEIKAAFADATARHPEYPLVERVPPAYSGAAGLGGRDTRVSDLIAAVENMAGPGGRRSFVLGIDHEQALRPKEEIVLSAAQGFSLRGHSVGGWGSITTNKILASLVSELFNLNVQAFPKYGSEKKGLPTNYYLVLSREPIRTHHELETVDFVAVHDPSALRGSNPFAGLQPGGWAYLQSPWRAPRELAEWLPDPVRRFLIDRDATLLSLDAVRIARELAPRPDLELRMQGIVLLGAILRVLPYRDPASTFEDLRAPLSESLRKYFGRRGEEVVAANVKAVQRGYEEVVAVPGARLKTIGGSHAVAAS